MKRYIAVLLLMIGTLLSAEEPIYQIDFSNGLDDKWRTLKAEGGYTPDVVDLYSLLAFHNKRLRLTDRLHNLSTAVTLDYEFPADGNKFTMEFDYYAYGACEDGKNYTVASTGAGKWGADGMSVILFDSSVGMTPRVGAYGGSLGYANMYDGEDDILGFEKGWLAIGLDEFGNFSTNDEGRNRLDGYSDSQGDEETEQPNRIALRGDESDGYRLLYVTDELANALARESVKENGQNTLLSNSDYKSGHYILTVDSTQANHLYITLKRDNQIVINNFDATAYQSDKPEKFRIAFSSGTGGGCNIHEIDNVKIYGKGNEYGYDYGDAKAVYPHVKHKISENLYLGNTPPDKENEQQSSEDASGDGDDDSDGVVSLPLLKVGDHNYTVPVRVYNNTGKDAYITAWIDFNQDGIFNFGEAMNVSEVKVPSKDENQTINIVWDDTTDETARDIYDTLKTGKAFMRIRLSTSRVLRCDAENYAWKNGVDEDYLVSPDGEVEDYVIDVKPNLTPVAEYRFDACSWNGTTGEVKDHIGAHHGTAVNSARPDRDAKIKRAAHFDGHNYIDTGDSFNDIFGTSNDTFTITAWIKPEKLTDAQTNHNTKNTFIAKASDPKNDNIEIGVNPDGSLHVYLDTQGKDKYADFGTGITEADKWYFIAVSYDGNKVKVQIDDQHYTNSTTWKNGGKIDQAVGSPFTIGASLHVDNFFHGNVDEVKIFDKVLSDAELDMIYRNEKADDGSSRPSQTCLIGEYRFDACEWFEPSGKIKDSVGGVDADPGKAEPVADAIIGRSARIADTAVEATPEYIFQNQPFTLSFWMKLEKLPTTSFMAIMRKEFELYVKSDGQINLNPKNGQIDIQSSKKIAAKAWHYITVVSDASIVKLYIDGQEMGSTDAKDLGKNGTTDLEIGKTGWTPVDMVEGFNGTIDELKIFDGALDATAIKSLITNDNAGKNYDGSKRTPLVCLDPVGCTGKAIVIDDTKFVHQIDLVTGDKNTTVMTDSQINGTSVNGFGYNVTDGYLWGSAIHKKGGYLVKIGKDEKGEFAQKEVGPIEGLSVSRGTYVGDIDHNGRLYIYYPGSGKMYVINLNKDLPDYLKVIDSYNIQKLNIADMAFNPQDKQLYAIENDNDLYRIDVQNHSVKLIKSAAVDEKTDTFGSSFFDAQGFFYAIKNSSRNVYRIDISNLQKVRSLIFSTLTNDQVQNVNIDGGRCNLKPIYIDYGDAPDGSSYSKGDGTGTLNYRTLTSDDGARHRLPSDENQTNVYLGNGVSAESDAKSSANDYNYDDDDGIVGGLKRLYTNMYDYDATLKVTNDTNRTAHLVGWIDFNRNGRFETKEGVAADIAPQVRQNVTLHWRVPDDIQAGVTYMRFRVTTDDMGIEEQDSYGAKGDGEVEDWQIEIKEGSLYDAWDIDSDAQHRVIKTKLVNQPFSLTVASVGRNGQLKESTGSDIRARIVSADDGSVLSDYRDVNLSVSQMVTLDIPAIAKATHKAVVQLRFNDEQNITREVNATDLFAIRPDHFTMQTDVSTLIAAKDFNLTIEATDANGTKIESFSLPKESYLLDINETKSQTLCGAPIALQKKQKHDFEAGSAKVTVNYPDIGNLKFWLREKPGSEFARIDAEDTPDEDRYIEDVHITHMVDPAKISLEWDLKNGDAINGVTYFNSYDHTDPEAEKMRASLDLKVTAQNDAGTPLQKFKDGCYAQDVDLGLRIKVESDDNGNYRLLSTYQDSNDTYLGASVSKFPDQLYQGVQPVQGFKIEKSLFTEGTGVKKMKFNFERDASKPLNPMRLKVLDVNATLDTLSDADTSGKELLFYYARAHIPDQQVIGKKGDAKVYYEVYCKGCDESAFGLQDMPESVDSIYWYRLGSISESEYLDFEDPAVTNGIASGMPGAISAQTNIFSVLEKPAGNRLLHIEVNKTPTIVRVKYKPKKYLVFNPFNKNALVQSFTSSFMPLAKSWAGKGDLGYTVDTKIAPRNNMDIIDW